MSGLGAGEQPQTCETVKGERSMAAELWLKELVSTFGAFLQGFIDVWWNLVASWFGL
jgi:hypothetical protein